MARFFFPSPFSRPFPFPSPSQQYPPVFTTHLPSLSLSQSYFSLLMLPLPTHTTLFGLSFPPSSPFSLLALLLFSLPLPPAQSLELSIRNQCCKKRTLNVSCARARERGSERRTYGNYKQHNACRRGRGRGDGSTGEGIDEGQRKATKKLHEIPLVVVPLFITRTSPFTLFHPPPLPTSPPLRCPPVFFTLQQRR